MAAPRNELAELAELEELERLEAMASGPVAAPAVTPAAATPSSMVRRFGIGARDPIDAGAQLLTRGLEGISPAGSSAEKFFRGERERVEEINRKVREGYQPPAGIDWARLLGGTAATAPLTLTPSGQLFGSQALGRTIAGAAAGGVSGALTPVEQPGTNFKEQKTQQMTTGALAGGLFAPLVGAASRVIAPRTSPEAQLLMREGVTLTPGQIAGGALGRVEAGATSIPIFGDAIIAAQRRGIEQFNRAVINRALLPLNRRLPAGRTGNEAIDWAANEISDAYNRVLPNITARADPAFVRNMQGLTQMASSLPDQQAQQFSRILGQHVLPRFSPNGTMIGTAMKDADSQLGFYIRQYSRSDNPDHRLLANALRQAQAELRNLAERSSPQQYAGQLRSANRAFAEIVRVENAAQRAGSKEGIFSPEAFRGAVRATDPSTRHRAFARGRAMSQDIAEAGTKVMGRKVPDSGTPFRFLNLATGAGAYYADPVLLGALASGYGIYSQPALRAIQALMTRRPAGAAQVAEGTRLLSPLFSAAAARGVNQP